MQRSCGEMSRVQQQGRSGCAATSGRRPFLLVPTAPACRQGGAAQCQQQHPQIVLAPEQRLRRSTAAFAVQHHTEEQVAAAVQPPAEPSQDSSKGVNTSSVWEIDFCSRPLLDERGKKLWELLICDPERTFEHAEYFPNSKINSVEVRPARPGSRRARIPALLAARPCPPPARESKHLSALQSSALAHCCCALAHLLRAQLKRAIDRVLARPGAVRPEKARFFRSQMQTIITKALAESDIKAVPSRRCFTVMCESATRKGGTPNSPLQEVPLTSSLVLRAAAPLQHGSRSAWRACTSRTRGTTPRRSHCSPWTWGRPRCVWRGGALSSRPLHAPRSKRAVYTGCAWGINLCACACVLPARHAPQPLPDALRGEQWAFVQLPLRTLQGLLERVEQVSHSGGIGGGGRARLTRCVHAARGCSSLHGAPSCGVRPPTTPLCTTARVRAAG